MDSENNQEVDRIAEEYLKESRDLRIKSLTHWAFLSGGTLTLLVPFVQSLHKQIISPSTLKWAGGLLILALICNSLGIGITSNTRYHYMLNLKGDSNYFIFWRPINDNIHLIGVSLYILGLIFAAVFVGKNIL